MRTLTIRSNFGAEVREKIIVARVLGAYSLEYVFLAITISARSASPQVPYYRGRSGGERQATAKDDTLVPRRRDRVNNQTEVAATIQEVIDDEEGIDPVQWSKLRVAIYMTTHVSEVHVAFLALCWPEATNKLKLFQDSDLILYTSTEIPNDILRKLPFKNIIVKNCTQLPIPDNAPFYKTESQKTARSKASNDGSIPVWLVQQLHTGDSSQP